MASNHPSQDRTGSDEGAAVRRTLDFGRAAPADRIYFGDSLAVADAVPAGALDLVYIDPPFGTGVTKRGRLRPSTDDATGPTAAATGRYADGDDDPDRFVAWLHPWLAASRRALADHGSLFVHLDYRAVHYVKVALDRLFGRERLVNEIVWCYAVGGKSRRGFGRKHDTILWYARGDEHAFYPDAIRVARRGGSHMRVVDGPDGPVQEKTDRKTGRVYRYPVAAGKIPEDWWTDVETLNHSDRERTGWPTQKPERLLERIVLATTRAGDRVGDWFGGSGTTAAVAQRTGRGFITADRERAAVDVIGARLDAQGQALAAAGTPPPPIAIDLAPRQLQLHAV